MAAFGKSIMDNLDDTKSFMQLDPAYEGVASDEMDDDLADDLIDGACYAFEAADIDDDDDYDDIVDAEPEDLISLYDDDFDDCEEDDDYDDIMDDDGSDDIMDDSLESAMRGLDNAIDLLEATEALREAGSSEDEIYDILDSMTAIEALTAELSDGKLITDDDIPSDEEDGLEEDEQNSTKNPKDEYNFNADGTEDAEEIDYSDDDDDDDLADLIDDDL